MTSHPKHKWPSVGLGEVAEFRNGVNYSKTNFGKGVKVIGVSDFQNNVKASFGVLEEINPAGVVRKEHYLKDGDILFVRSNGNRELIGRNMFVESPPPGVTHSAFSIRLRFVREDCLPRFYAYVLRSPLFRQSLSLHGGGTNISNLNQDILGRLRVPLPPSPIQHQIASILSAYDDLIENNTYRIKILEQMAQMLFQEWFINFHFPGHEHAKLVDSDLGLPAGWAAKRIGEIAAVKGGKRLSQGKTVQDSATNHPYLRVTDMNESGVDISGIKYIDEEAFRPISRYTIASSDIYISIAGTIGRVGIVPSVISGASLTENAAKITEIREITQSILLYYLRSKNGQDQIASKVVGTSQPKLALFRIKEVTVPIPPKMLQERIEPFLADTQAQIELLQRKNYLLRKTCDMLLPKIVSGEVSVGQLETKAVAQTI
jgi:type I restriction enzyme S subunit